MKPPLGAGPPARCRRLNPRSPPPPSPPAQRAPDSSISSSCSRRSAGGAPTAAHSQAQKAGRPCVLAGERRSSLLRNSTSSCSSRGIPACASASRLAHSRRQSQARRRRRASQGPGGSTASPARHARDTTCRCCSRGNCASAAGGRCRHPTSNRPSVSSWARPPSAAASCASVSSASARPGSGGSRCGPCRRSRCRLRRCARAARASARLADTPFQPLSLRGGRRQPDRSG